ncbi:MAG: BamA/TamA family outer membrane protein, partial [Sphingopyxis sp.]|nr:BamA/TamA family outer membrane protein [Sphingopyxis sp.]
NISVGGSIFRRDLNSFNFVGNNRETTFEQVTTGFQTNIGVPLTEFLSAFASYSLSIDDVSLDRDTFFFGDECDVLVAGRFLCDAIGKRTTSLLALTVAFDNRDNRIRPTRGQAVSLRTDLAGLGGSVRYLRGVVNASKHFNLGSGFILTTAVEGGYIYSFGNRPTPTSDRVRLTDRFFLGEPQIRGFDIRGVGPRVIRFADVDLTDTLNPVLDTSLSNRQGLVDDALGGRAYYRGRVEVDIPLGSGAKELGLRPSVFLDVGSVFQVRRPVLTTLADFRDPADGRTKNLCRNAATGGISFGSNVLADGTTQNLFNLCPAGTTSNLSPFEERFFGDTIKPRVAIGAGVNWNSPFGPFRIDFAYALLEEEGDDTKRFSFNVGTQF